MTTNAPIDIDAEIQRRLRRGQTPAQLIKVGERTNWWTADDVDRLTEQEDGVAEDSRPGLVAPVRPAQPPAEVYEALEQWAQDDAIPTATPSAPIEQANAAVPAADPGGGEAAPPPVTSVGMRSHQVDLLAVGLAHADPKIRAKAARVLAVVDDLCRALARRRT